MNQSSPRNFNRLPQVFPGSIFVFSFFFILLVTLFPFNFSTKNVASVSEIINRFDLTFWKPGALGDWIRNCCLFFPLGWGLTALLRHRISAGSIRIAVIVFSSLGLSLTIEILQVFLPSRAPTLTDILANTIGGFLGLLVFYSGWLGAGNYAIILLKKIQNWFSLKKLAIALLIYMIAILSVVINLEQQTSLANWNTNFPLLIGNEKTGNRAWYGSISQLEITNRALSSVEVKKSFAETGMMAVLPNALIAAYQFGPLNQFADQTGNLPDLVWQVKSEKIPKKSEFLLNSNQWLSTEIPPILLTEKIRETSQFTLSFFLKTLDPEQSGLVRIISLSLDPYQRNLTIGQDQSNLLIRLRTPITGKNGDRPQLIIPEVFQDENFHHFIITYDGINLRVYRDQFNQDYSISLTPEITFFRYILFPFSSYSWEIYVLPLRIFIYKIFFYGIVLIPVGFLVACLRPLLKLQKKIYYILAVMGVILIPVLLLESVLTMGSHRKFSGENMLLSLVIVGGTMLVVAKQQSYLKILMAQVNIK